MNTDWLSADWFGPLQQMGGSAAAVWAVGITAVAALWWWATRPSGRKTAAEPLTLAWSPRSDRALRKAEVATYFRLREALPQHIILSQVQMSRFLRVTTRLSYSGWMRRVGARCVDFLVCDADGMVVAVIELEPEPIGGTLGSGVARRKHKVLKAAEIPVLYWDAAQLPSVAHIRATMMSVESGRSLIAGPEGRPPQGNRPTPPVGMTSGAFRAYGGVPSLAEREDRFGLVGRRG